MSNQIDVLVQVFDRGRTRTQIVPVEESCFEREKSCWKTIACIKAAVLLELPFAWLLERAKYGLRPEDKARLRELYCIRQETDEKEGVTT